MKKYSLTRLWAVMIKEFIQIKRDKPTLMMMVGIPIMQLVLFGYAINTNPRHLPTALVSADNSVYTRTFLQALDTTRYFKFIPGIKTEKEADELLDAGKVLMVISIPPKFSQKLIRGEKPQILLEVDATDPVSTSRAVNAVTTLAERVFNQDLKGTLQKLQAKDPPFELILHERYNPESITQYNIVPGLLGVILSLTMVFITALAMTRERERGTMENLLATPVKPIEVIIGKIAPYILIGYVQGALIILASFFLFQVPIQGSLILLIMACLPFIFANLAMGLTFSTLAKNQIQAINGAMFFFLPSILLSGFMFPFLGMPTWAQWVGETLPLTHFVRITRGILLKGNGLIQVWPQIWPILLFTVIVVAIGIKRFRKTLD